MTLYEALLELEGAKSCQQHAREKAAKAEIGVEKALHTSVYRPGQFRAVAEDAAERLRSIEEGYRQGRPLQFVRLSKENRTHFGELLDAFQAPWHFLRKDRFLETYLTSEKIMIAAKSMKGNVHLYTMPYGTIAGVALGAGCAAAQAYDPFFGGSSLLSMLSMFAGGAVTISTLSRIVHSSEFRSKPNPFTDLADKLCKRGEEIDALYEKLK